MEQPSAVRQVPVYIGEGEMGAKVQVKGACSMFIVMGVVFDIQVLFVSLSFNISNVLGSSFSAVWYVWWNKN